MVFGKLFVADTLDEAERGKPVAATAPRGSAVGIFITPKSLLAFPTASFAVTLLALFTQKLFPVLAASAWVPVAGSCFVGLIIFISTISEPRAKPRSWQGWFVSVAVAVLNSVYLAATSMGLLNEIR
jgi:hypothetical protein